jgi:hypothetical protein
VYIRNCSRCTFVAVTRQLRLRDCGGCGLSLYCRTQPAVESCADLTFGCFRFPYKGLAAQMRACKLSPFTNFFADGHDFTPNLAAGGAHAAASWRVVDDGAADDAGAQGSAAEQLGRFFSSSNGENGDGEDAIHLSISSGGGSSSDDGGGDDAPEAVGSSGRSSERALPQEVSSLLTTDRLGLDSLSALPITGAAPPAGSCLLFLLFPPGTQVAALQLVAEQFGGDGRTAAENPLLGRCSCVLLRTNEAELSAGPLRKMAAASGWSGTAVKQFVIQGKSAKHRRRRQQQQWRRQRSTNEQSVAAAAAVQGQAACVGLEVACSCGGGCGGQQGMTGSTAASCRRLEALVQAAENLGALVSTSQPAAEAFRFLGF